MFSFDHDESRPTRQRGPYVLLFRLSLVMYLLSFFLPAYAETTNGKMDSFAGYDAFAAAFGLPFSPALSLPIASAAMFGSAWLANPCFWLAAACFYDRRYLLASILGAGGPILSLPIWIVFRTGDQSSLLAGFYLWVSSMVTLASAASIMWRKTEGPA